MKNYKKIIAIAVATIVVLQSAVIGMMSFAESSDVFKPIAQYTFEDAGNLGKDTSGNGNHLSVVRGTPTSVEGKYGKAAVFDGASILETASKEDFSDSLVDYTISFWAQRKEDSGSEMIAIGSGFRTSGPGVHINFNGGGYFCVGLRHDGASWNHYPTGGTTVSKMDFYTITVSGGGKKLTMYINGQELVSGQGVWYDQVNGTFKMNNPDNPFCIGGLGNGGGFIGYGFVGTIDEVNVFDSGLTTAQVQELYKSYSSYKAKELVAQYKFENPDNLGEDTSGNGNHLTVSHGTPASIGSTYGNAVEFNGSSNLETASKVDFTDELVDFTFAYWAQRKGTAPDGAMAMGGGWRDSSAGIQIWNSDEYFCVGLRESDNTGSWNWYNTGKELPYLLNFYAVTVSDGGKKLTMYMNGTKIADATYDENAGTYLMNNTSVPFSIGASSDGSGWLGYAFKGIIDEVNIYNYGLTEAEIKELYDSYSNYKRDELIAQYKFDDAENLGEDTSGKGNHLSVSNGTPTSVKGQSGNAVKFDGQSNLETESKIDFTDELVNFTFSYWAQREGTAPDGAMAMGGGWRDSSAGIQIFNNDDYFCIGLRESDNTGSWNHYGMGSGLPYEMNFYTVTVSDGGKKLTMYINGQKLITGAYYDTNSGTYLMDNYNVPFSIGASSDGSGWLGYAFKGIIDEVNIYNYALTENQVAELYLSYTTKELIGHYTFNDAENIGKDTSGKNNNLTAIGNPVIDDGVDGMGLKLDGTSALKSASNLDFTDNLLEYTMTFWAKRDADKDTEMIAIGTGYRSQTAGVHLNLNDGYFCAGFRKNNSTELWKYSQTDVTSEMNFYSVIVSDLGQRVRLYVNGVEVSSETIDDARLIMSNLENGFSIGALVTNNETLNYAFSGIIDEVSIYNYALKKDEIEDLYEIYEDAVSGSGIVVPEHSLVAQYSFDDAENIGKDNTGRFDLKNNGGVTLVDNGKKGKAASFNGKTNDDSLYLDVKDFTDKFDEITLNFYARVKSDSQKDNVCVFSTGWDTTGGVSFGYCGENTLFFDSRTKNSDTVWLTAKTGISISEEFIGYTLSITDGGKTVSFYVDGMLVLTKTYDEPIDFRGNYNLVLGSVSWGGYLFSGEIDELSIYNYGMTEAEVGKLYNLSQNKVPNLVSLYSFEQAAEIGRDSVGGHHLTNRGGVAAYSEGYKGSAAYFAGIDWKDSLIYEGEDFLRTLSSFTVNFYAKVDDDVADNACVISTGWDGGNGISIGLRPKNWFFIDSETQTDKVVWEAVKTNVEANADFHAYSVTYSAKDLKLMSYVDGNLISTVELDTPLNMESDFQLMVGQVAWSGYMFKGWIDELAIYDKAFSEAEIAKLVDKKTESNGGGNAPSDETDTDTDKDSTNPSDGTTEKPIDKAEIPNQSVDKNDDTNDGGNSAVIVIILIAVAAVVAIAGVVGLVIFLICRKKK